MPQARTATAPSAPGADSRTESEPDMPGTPDLNALVSLWATRDAQYATLARPLSPSAVEAIRQFRLKEVNDLPVKQRACAAMKVLGWYPPQHGQGTGSDATDGLSAWLR